MGIYAVGLEMQVWGARRFEYCRKAGREQVMTISKHAFWFVIQKWGAGGGWMDPGLWVVLHCSASVTNHLEWLLPSNVSKCILTRFMRL